MGYIDDTVTLTLRELSNGNVGTVCPTTSRAKDFILKDLDLSKEKIVVEFGPGLGPICYDLIDKTGKDAKILLFEIDELFNLKLQDNTNNDKRVKVYEDAVGITEAINGYGAIDVCISGIPYNVFHPAKTTEIFTRLRNKMDKESKLIIYLHDPLVKRTINKILSVYDKFSRTIDNTFTVEDQINNFFKIEKKEHYYKNIPPLEIYSCSKR